MDTDFMNSKCGHKIKMHFIEKLLRTIGCTFKYHLSLLIYHCLPLCCGLLERERERGDGEERERETWVQSQERGR